MVSMYTITQYISNICLGFNKEVRSVQKSQVSITVAIAIGIYDCYDLQLSLRCNLGFSRIVSASFSGDNFRFMIASNMEVIVPLLGDLTFLFLFTIAICLRLDDLIMCDSSDFCTVLLGGTFCGDSVLEVGS